MPPFMPNFDERLLHDMYRAVMLGYNLDIRAIKVAFDYELENLRECILYGQRLHKSLIN